MHGCWISILYWLRYSSNPQEQIRGCILIGFDGWYLIFCFVCFGLISGIPVTRFGWLYIELHLYLVSSILSKFSRNNINYVVYLTSYILSIEFPCQRLGWKHLIFPSVLFWRSWYMVMMFVSFVAIDEAFMVKSLIYIWTALIIHRRTLQWCVRVRQASAV